MPSHHLPDTIDAFLAHLRHDRAYAPATVAGYQHDLLAAADYLARRGCPPDVRAVTSEALRDFLRQPNGNGHAPAARSRNRRLATLRAIFRWAQAEGLRPDDPTAGLTWSQVRPRDPPSFAEADVRAIVEAARRNPNRWHAVRDEAVLVILAMTGLRLRELTRLDVAQVDLDDARLRRVRRKGGAERDLVINGEVVRVLRAWLRARRRRARSGELALFLSRQRRRLSPRMVEVLVAGYARVAGIRKPVTPHTFRHSFCYLVQKRGAAMRAAQELMNHARIQTTALYSRASERDLREAVGRLEDLTRPHRRAMRRPSGAGATDEGRPGGV